MQLTAVAKQPLAEAVNKTVLAKYGVGSNEPTSVENIETQDNLANFVKKQFNRAETHKRVLGIEARLLRNLYAKKCEYPPEELVDAQANVYIGIAALKARAAEAWMTDILINNLDKPWTMKPTPIPDLPEVAKEQVVELLMQELSSFQTIQDIKDRAKDLKSVALDQANQAATKAAGNMETLIEDQFGKGDFKETFSELIEDISTYPSVFVRGPVLVSKKLPEWKNNTFGAKVESVPCCRTINPFDAFPSPTSTTPGDGEFFIERNKMLPSVLYNNKDVKGFDEVNIREALDKYPDGYSLHLQPDAERNRLEQKDAGATNEKTTTLDIIIYNGLVKGQYLIDSHVLVSDPQKFYEAEIWVLGEFVIKAVLNPNILDKRPIYSTSYITINRNMWGQSVIDLVYDCMRVCNATVRSLVRNMGYASGPIGEVVAERISDGTDPRNIAPYTIIQVTPDLSGAGAPVLRFENVQSISDDLLKVFEKFSAIADDLSGIPPYVLGNPQVAGAGRTLGGLSMLMGNAAKGIKRVQVNVDKDIIAPLVTAYYIYNMQVSKDTSVKGDASVVAQGATGLLQKELQQSKLVDILNLLVPLIPQWDNLPNGIKIVMREIMKQAGLPVDDIIADPMKQQELMDKVREFQQNQAFRSGSSVPQNLPTQSLPPPQVPAGPMPQGITQ